ncbi:hypothetical protein FF80_00298 [Devosia sp. LC5]|uniref:hypothetical protein n=1 Tax=Devosia sp. LC5 TaxID=1502724 RepID=UPI0004E46290|nr:hypothetical protein [Devosia sp. LC5]KFC72541.1 hypothetical protein FF80_00298 [Devosia sp. LC5]
MRSGDWFTVIAIVVIGVSAMTFATTNLLELVLGTLVFSILAFQVIRQNRKK